MTGWRPGEQPLLGFLGSGLEKGFAIIRLTQPDPFVVIDMDGLIYQKIEQNTRIKLQNDPLIRGSAIFQLDKKCGKAIHLDI
jgi:hypothetical protein